MLRRKLIVAWVAAAIGIAAAISLADWQTRRGDANLALQAQTRCGRASTAARHRAVALIDRRRSGCSCRARFASAACLIPTGTVYLDNRTLNGVAGFYVITALVIGEGLPAVLIDRGFKAHDMLDRAHIGAAMPPSGRVTIEGLAVARPSALLELGGKSEHRVPGIWQNLDYTAYEQATGRSVARFVIRLSSDVQSDNATDGLRREWPRPASGVEKHRGYAFQWYSLAVLIAALAGFFGWKAWRER